LGADSGRSEWREGECGEGGTSAKLYHGQSMLGLPRFWEETK
jgi:hypothetical protein